MSYLTFHSCQRTCENIKTPTFKSKLILAPAQSVWSWYEIENYENLEPHSFGSTKPISEAPQDEIDIESPIALAAKSRDQRLRPIPSDCSHNHQSSFFKLQLFFNEIIISYADSRNALIFFKSPPPTLTKAKIMFFSFLAHHKVLWLVDVWGHGGTDETETFYERSSWQRITNFWWHKLFTQAFVFIIIATLIGIITRFI